MKLMWKGNIEPMPRNPTSMGSIEILLKSEQPLGMGLVSKE